MIALFQNRAFTKLFLANFASQLGTVVGNMAFAFYLLDRFAEQPYYATLAELMYALPTLFVFFVVGVAADRLNRKRIAANSDWIRAALTALLLLAVHLNWLVPAFALLFLRSAASKFFAPAEAGLLQGILAEDQYIQASGLNQTVAGLFMLFGMGLGVIAYRTFGIEGAVAVDGVSFLVSGALIASCRFADEVVLPNGPARREHFRWNAVWSDFRAGLSYIVRNRLLLAIISGYFIFGFVNGVFAVLPMFTMKYKLSPEHYQTYSSLIMICLGIGFLLGSAFAAPLIKKLSPALVLIGGVLLCGGMAFALGLADAVWFYLALFLILGVIIAPINVVLGGWVPELTLPSQIGRVNAWIDPIQMLAHSLSLGLVALLFPAIVSISAMHFVLAGCLLAAGLYYGIVLPPLERRRRLAAAQQRSASS
ncbi:MFS transporter [Gordoniibacillus kamchatkensis]|uniref:MFS transporter n=1 Tax=Gordoniibacillus kamchatkensis TaxID=1590651 RepID=UPI000696AEC2|nr:MFS transporter [Paenibacillus sp. VKM B-2647]